MLCRLFLAKVDSVNLLFSLLQNCEKKIQDWLSLRKCSVFKATELSDLEAHWATTLHPSKLSNNPASMGTPLRFQASVFVSSSPYSTWVCKLHC
jgi:hypothetical protein